ncbi:restriction endonuclease [Tychonema sp. LEGE 07203]|uniref:restriction endonuclease n=1 Tax=Tychonema sp. LEGE 07203 TaxID=1828671 RepID=UPI00188288EF|nr:restriction endonuclease [Tychonema sp. LEGE 07203]MBE9096511.1 restriction endonuclease [Tychonema sp. LEGE 07203]
MKPFLVRAAAIVGDIAALVFDTIKEEESKKLLLDSGILEVDEMTGKEFENFLEIHFKKLGYIVNLTQDSQDYGADLVLYKDGAKTVFQAKRSKNPVGIKAVQEVAGAVRHYKGNKGRVITNNRFTENACKLAKSNDVELWDRKKLIEFILIAKNCN